MHTVCLPVGGCSGSQPLRRCKLAIPAGKYYRRAVRAGECCGARSILGLLFVSSLEMIAIPVQATTSTQPGDMYMVTLTIHPSGFPGTGQAWILGIEWDILHEENWTRSVCFLGGQVFVASPKL